VEITGVENARGVRKEGGKRKVENAEVANSEGHCRGGKRRTSYGKPNTVLKLD